MHVFMMFLWFLLPLVFAELSLENKTFLEMVLPKALNGEYFNLTSIERYALCAPGGFYSFMDSEPYQTIFIDRYKDLFDDIKFTDPILHYQLFAGRWDLCFALIPELELNMEAGDSNDNMTVYGLPPCIVNVLASLLKQKTGGLNVTTSEAVGCGAGCLFWPEVTDEEIDNTLHVIEVLREGPKWDVPKKVSDVDKIYELMQVDMGLNIERNGREEGE